MLFSRGKCQLMTNLKEKQMTSKKISRRRFLLGSSKTVAGIAAGAALNSFASSALSGQKSRVEQIAAIPRIDVHSHLNSDYEKMDNLIEIRKIIKKKHNIELAMWVDLGYHDKGKKDSRPGRKERPIGDIQEIERKYNGRFLTCICDFDITDGLRYSPEEIAEWHERGVVGYKIYPSLDPGIDTPANAPTFYKMEQIGMVGASIHISQTLYSIFDSAVTFWRCHQAWKNVLDRHPNLKVVNAHMLDLFNSDCKLGHLVYMLETYPNLNVDLCGRYKDTYTIDTDKLREFMIKYSDRILFGTDVGMEYDKPGDSRNLKRGNYETIVEQYHRVFKILEEDGITDHGWFGGVPTEVPCLNLPIDTLEKIYYKNAMRIYPHVEKYMKKLGYNVD